MLNFFLTTVIRAKERKVIPSIIQLIKKALEKDVALSMWVIETFS